MLNTYNITSWEKKRLLNAVARLMEQYVEQTFDEEYSNQDIKNLYGNAASGFGRITQNQQNNGLPIYAQPQQQNNGGFGGNNGMGGCNPFGAP